MHAGYAMKIDEDSRGLSCGLSRMQHADMDIGRGSFAPFMVAWACVLHQNAFTVILAFTHVSIWHHGELLHQCCHPHCSMHILVQLASSERSRGVPEPSKGSVDDKQRHYGWSGQSPDLQVLDCQLGDLRLS